MGAHVEKYKPRTSSPRNIFRQIQNSFAVTQLKPPIGRPSVDVMVAPQWSGRLALLDLRKKTSSRINTNNPGRLPSSPN